MRIGSKGYYGLLALSELVQCYRTGGPVQVKEIARRQEIPEEYLSQIMAQLKRANLVRGARGPGGGYFLGRAPESITLREVLTVLEGPLMGIELKSNRKPRLDLTMTQKLIETRRTCTIFKFFQLITK
ncbi:MAG: Rrf2 family transcriptional regulator [Deltaproteobacteria bacterium]|nr:Rrf2 family transcriptional regulator [Deltaproteobacteria bacterium]